MKLHPYLSNDQLQEVLQYVNDKDALFRKLENIDSQLELTLLTRLNKWFQFFNEQYSKSICIYSNTIFALVDAAKKNQLFKTQTAHEFELSISFYKIVFSSKTFLKLEDIQDATLLLNISLIFGKYPGMLQNSIIKSIPILNKGITEARLKVFFERLFVKYENPTIFTRNINLLSEIEIEAMMILFQGNNLGKFEKSPYPISKKESYLLLNELPNDISFKDNILKRAIICSKLLLVQNANKKYLNTFLSSSKTFEHRLTTFYDDILFWKTAFKLVCEINKGNYYLGTQEIVDYFEFKKYFDDKEYSLKGRTANSINIAIQQWHDAAAYAKNLELLNLEWIGNHKQIFKLKEGEQSFLFKEITNGKELFAESNALKHCVFSYIDSCSSGHTSIWSMQKEIETIYQPYITIEVVKNKVRQIAGFRNREITKSEYTTIKKWSVEFEFELEYVFLE